MLLLLLLQLLLERVCLLLLLLTVLKDVGNQELLLVGTVIGCIGVGLVLELLQGGCRAVGITAAAIVVIAVGHGSHQLQQLLLVAIHATTVSSHVVHVCIVGVRIRVAFVDDAFVSVGVAIATKTVDQIARFCFE